MLSGAQDVVLIVNKINYHFKVVVYIMTALLSSFIFLSLFTFDFVLLVFQLL